MNYTQGLFLVKPILMLIVFIVLEDIGPAELISLLSAGLLITSIGELGVI